MSSRLSESSLEPCLCNRMLAALSKWYRALTCSVQVAASQLWSGVWERRRRGADNRWSTLIRLCCLGSSVAQWQVICRGFAKATLEA